MATRKSRVKIEIILLILQEDIAKMGITMSNNSHSLTRRIENNLSPLNQPAQRYRILIPIDSPRILEQFLEQDTLFYILSILAIWKRNSFSGIKALEPSTC